MARITWQNVDAPDLTAGLARANGALAIAAGANTIGDLFTGIGARKDAERARASNATAAAALLGIQDVGAYDAAAKGGNIFNTLGLPAGAVNEDVVKMALGWRDRLEGDRSADLDNVRDNFDYTRDQFDHTRDQLDYSKDLYDFDRTKIGDVRADEAFARTEADRVLQENSLERAYRTAMGVANPAEAQVQARNASGSGREMLAVNAALTTLGDAPYATTGAGIQNPATTQTLGTISADLTKREQDLAYEYGGNPLAQLWTESSTLTEGYATPLDGLISNLGAEVGDENPEAFGQKKGQVTASFNKLKQAYPGVPQGIVATVMRNNLRDDGWIFTGDNVELDDRAIRQQLETLSTPEGRNGLAQISTDYATRKQAIADSKATAQKLTDEIQILQDKPASPTRDADIAKREGQLQALFESLRTSAPSPAQELAAAVVTPSPTEAGAAPAAAAAPITAEEAMVRQNQALRSAAGTVGSAIDQGVASILTAPATALGGLGQVGSRIVGAVASPSLGAEGLQFWQNWNSDVASLRDGGLTGAQAQVNSAAEQVLASPPAVAPSVAANVPSAVHENVTSIAKAVGIDPKGVGEILSAVATMNDPKATPAQKTRAQVWISRFVSRAGFNAEKLDDSQIELLANPEAWLKQD